MEISKRLDIIREDAKSCMACLLHKTKTNIVFSRGSEDAKIFIVGEAPGETEDLEGKPFLGKSGKLLDATLASYGLDLEKDIYIANVIKCRPPENRKPDASEVNKCSKFLTEQLNLVNPKVIIALGATAAKFFTPYSSSIGAMRGTTIEYKFSYHKPRVFITYHPSFILRSGGTLSENFKMFSDDIKQAIDYANK